MFKRLLAFIAMVLPGRVVDAQCSYAGSFDLSIIDPNSDSVAPAVLIGTSNIRCTEAARDRLDDNDVCYQFVETSNDQALFNYMRCLHPTFNMHSWVYFDGQFVGDGFRLLSNPSDSRCIRPDPSGGSGSVHCFNVPDFQDTLIAAAVPTNCRRDCSAIVDDQFPARFPAPFESTIENVPLVLFGWTGCPCTNFAREHFQTLEYCYDEDVWPDAGDKLFAYLQCRYGSEHHSFIFLGGQFLGNGFAFNVHDPTAEFGNEAALAPLAEAAGVLQTCPFLGLQNLLGGELQSCTQDNDQSNTGWTRSGSCNWDAADGGYHEVCVEMTHEFLVSSADVDGNDLSSVVSQGGHWCICAWAFASAVSNDPAGAAAGHPQGITLECEGTNGKLRDVYSHFATLQSPTHHSYLSVPALELVNNLCPFDQEVDVEGHEVTVIEDETDPDEDPCYLLEMDEVTFPLWEPVCPDGIIPLPDNCADDICKDVYLDWWEQCSGDDFVMQLDQVTQSAFSDYALMCKTGH